MSERGDGIRSGELAQKLARPARLEGGPQELMDSPDYYDRRVVAEALKNLENLSRYTGGLWFVERALFDLWGENSGPLSVLEIASGSGALASQLMAGGRRRGLRTSVVASDLSPEILELARSMHPPRQLPDASLGYALADARSLPFADDSFDITTCSLVLHHFEPPEAAAVLAEMQRVSRFGIVVDDLVRSRQTLFAVWSLTRLLCANPLNRYDGPLSVRKSYTPAELATLARRAGITVPLARYRLPSRVVLTAKI